MDKLLLLFVIAIVAAPAAIAVRNVCRSAPRRRPWLIAGSVVVLAGVAFAVPHLGEVVPRGMRESPAGFIPLFGAAALLAISALLALGALIGVGLSLWSLGGGADD